MTGPGGAQDAPRSPEGSDAAAADPSARRTEAPPGADQPTAPGASPAAAAATSSAMPAAHAAAPGPDAAPPPGADPAARAAVRLRPRRAQAFSALLPVLGTFLLAPPFVLVFARPVQVFGVPLLLAYLALVWLALILGAGRLSGRLRRRLALAHGGPPAAQPPLTGPPDAPPATGA